MITDKFGGEFMADARWILVSRTKLLLTIPEFLSDPGETEAADIESAAFMGGILDGCYQAYTVSEDGTVTFTMTEEQHQEALAILSAALQDSIAEVFPNEENYPSIQGMEFSENGD